MSPLFDSPEDNLLRILPGQQLELVHPDWLPVLREPDAAQALDRLDAFLHSRLDAGASIYPRHVFRALEELSPAQVRVVILGQDPYHGPGQAQGLAFSVPDTCATPPSLRNILNELARSYPDRPRRTRNDLSDWTAQGVLLLNTCLTVEEGKAGSHARRGWEVVTDAILRAVAAAPQPKVFMLWGNPAQAKQALIEQQSTPRLILRANHPSPLSALRPPRPFIGCGHFTQANAWLNTHGDISIDWIGEHPYN